MFFQTATALIVNTKQKVTVALCIYGDQSIQKVWIKPRIFR